MWNVGIVVKVGMCSRSVTKSSVTMVNRGRHLKANMVKPLSTKRARNYTTRVLIVMWTPPTLMSQKTEVGALVQTHQTHIVIN